MRFNQRRRNGQFGRMSCVELGLLREDQVACRPMILANVDLNGHHLLRLEFVRNAAIKKGTNLRTRRRRNENDKRRTGNGEIFTYYWRWR